MCDRPGGRVGDPVPQFKPMKTAVVLVGTQVSQRPVGHRRRCPAGESLTAEIWMHPVEEPAQVMSRGAIDSYHSGTAVSGVNGERDVSVIRGGDKADVGLGRGQVGDVTLPVHLRIGSECAQDVLSIS